MRQMLMLLVGLVSALAAAAWLAVQFLKPLPEARIVMATGGADGSYAKLAQSWKAELKNRFGVELVLEEKIESAEALEALLEGNIDAGFIRGGYLTSLKYRDLSVTERAKFEQQVSRLSSIGRMFYEPLWVYYRGPSLVNSLGDFKGKRIIIGTRDSGTADVVKLLLRVNGLFGERVDWGDPPPQDPLPKTFIEQDFPPNAKPLKDDSGDPGAADVAFLSLPSDHETVRFLLHDPNILLMDFSEQADAYVIRFPFLSKLVMYRGSFRLHPDLPTANITLLATAPALVVSAKLHPALVSLLTHASWVHPKPGIDDRGYPVVFYEAGKFPNGNDPEFAVDPAAKAYYKSGELPLLLRSIGPFNARIGIPFWVTAVAYQHGTKIVLLAIPILSILIPLSRFLPLLYGWIIRRRLLYWYDRLKALEMTLDQGRPTPQQLVQVNEELQKVDYAVSRLRLPRPFSSQLYELRSYINLVERRLNAKQAFL